MKDGGWWMEGGFVLGKGMGYLTVTSAPLNPRVGKLEKCQLCAILLKQLTFVAALLFVVIARILGQIN